MQIFVRNAVLKNDDDSEVELIAEMVKDSDERGDAEALRSLVNSYM